MYGTCEIDWAKANFSTIYKSYIVSIFICCFFLPVTVMVFSYVSIINTVKLSHALTGLGDPTDRQRRIERDVTRVSLGFISGGIPLKEICLSKNWSQLGQKRAKPINCISFLHNSSDRVWSQWRIWGLKFLLHQLVNIGATSHLKNNLIGVGYIAQPPKFGLACALFFQKLHYFWAYSESRVEISVYSLFS